MEPAGLHCRLAAPGDRGGLSGFVCTSADPRLEQWIRGDALDRQLRSTAADDFRLLVFHDDAGAIVAVTGHERNFPVVDAYGDSLPGSYLMIVAITDRFRDGRSPDGRPLIVALLDATFEDVRGRGRGNWVTMMVHTGNEDGTRIVARLKAKHVGTSEGDDVYVLRLD